MLIRQLKSNVLELQHNRLIIKGKIDFNNANDVFEQGKSLLKPTSVVDLMGLEHGNTLVLAILVQWLRLFPHLTFDHIPEKMTKIIQSCHLDVYIKKAS